MALDPRLTRRVMEIRRDLMKIAEGLTIDSVSQDYRARRDPTKNLQTLVELQALKRKLGLGAATKH